MSLVEDDGWVGGWIDGRMDRWTTDRQTDSENNGRGTGDVRMVNEQVAWLAKSSPAWKEKPLWRLSPAPSRPHLDSDFPGVQCSFGLSGHKSHHS